MEDSTTNLSPSEASVVVPGPQDLEEVIQLSGRVARLEQDLELARFQLRDAWTRVPYDPAVLRKPYQADIAVACHVCDRPTKWRTPRGIAEHLECPVSTVSIRPAAVSNDVFDILLGLTGDDNDESLNDD